MRKAIGTAFETVPILWYYIFRYRDLPPRSLSKLPRVVTLVSAILMETDEDWETGRIYLNIGTG